VKADVDVVADMHVDVCLSIASDSFVDVHMYAMHTRMHAHAGGRLTDAFAVHKHTHYEYARARTYPHTHNQTHTNAHTRTHIHTHIFI